MTLRARTSSALAAAAGGLLLLGSGALSALPAAAAPVDTAPIAATMTPGTFGYTLVEEVSDEPLRDTILFEATDAAGNTYPAYCIELFVHPAPGDPGAEQDVTLENDADIDFGASAYFTDAIVNGRSVVDRVDHILSVGYPSRSLTELAAAAGIADLSEAEAITATQGAIWVFTESQQQPDGSWATLDFPAMQNPDGTALDQQSQWDVEALAQYLMNSSDNAVPLPRVDLVENTDGTVTVRTNQAGGVEVTSTLPLRDGTGAELGDVATVADGTVLSGVAPAGQTATWDVRAETLTATGAPRVLLADTPDRHQLLLQTSVAQPAWDAVTMAVEGEDPVLPTVTTRATPGDAVLPADGSGVDLKDTAIIDGTVPADDWTLEFELFRAPENGDLVCTDSVGTVDPVTLAAGEMNQTEILSDAVKVTEVGTYYWVETVRDGAGDVVHQGECGLPNETVTVTPETPTNPVLPTVTTRATPGDAVLPADGSGVDLKDTAIIDGTVPADDWTLEFELFRAPENGDLVCTDSVGTVDPVTLAAGEMNQTEILSDAVKVTEVGTYYWVETVRDGAGDVVHQGECGLPNETVTVRAEEPGKPTGENPGTTPGTDRPSTNQPIGKRPGVLARTGAEVLTVAATGLGLTAAGAMLLWLRHRRTA